MIIYIFIMRIYVKGMLEIIRKIKKISGKNSFYARTDLKKNLCKKVV